MKPTPRFMAPALAALMWSICGCTTYVGQKMGADGALPKQDAGVPFVMTKPQYKVDITADANDPTKAIYTITADDVPDATQRFTIALDPALFVDGKFDLDFGTNGNLTGATATTTSRLVDTFASFIAVALKVKSAAFLDSVTTMQEYKKAVSASTDPACTRTDPASGVKVQAAIEAEIKNLETEAKREAGDSKNAAKVAAELVASRLHYTDVLQRDCMAAVAVTISGLSKGPEDTFNSQVKGARDAARADKADDSAIDTIQALVTALDEEGLKAIQNDLKGKAAPLDSKIRETAAAGERLVGAKLHSRFARSLPDMSTEVWRARHLSYLERRIAARKLDSLLSLKEPKSERAERAARDIAALQSEWAATLGETATVQRVGRIDGFLSSIKDLSPDSRRSGANEQVKLREERDKLQARIDQARADLLAKNKVVPLSREKPAPGKVEPRSNQPVTLVTRDYVTKANATPAAFGNLPEFVIVIEPDRKGAIETHPEPAGDKK